MGKSESRAQSALVVEAWPLDRPKPYENNPRIIPQSAIEKVAKSIEEFGWRQPIVVDSEDVVVVGHTRLLAAKHLGLDSVPVHVVTDLSEAQVKAYRLADNRSGEEAAWDRDLLTFEFTSLADEAFELSFTGFDAPEITLPDAPVSFDPVSVEEQPSLDEKSGRAECPKCGYRWKLT